MTRVRAVFSLLAAVLLSVLLVAPASAQTTVPMGPGFRYNGDGSTSGYCSLAAIGWDDLGNLVGLTAAHCMEGSGGPGGPVYGYGRADAGPIGRFSTHNAAWWAYYAEHGDSFPFDSSMDYSVIVFNDAVTAQTGVSPGGLRYRAVGAPGPFQWTCKDGGTTGVTCGPVTEVNNRNEVRAWTPVWFGDSGSGLQAGGLLVGITSALNPLAPWGPFQFVNITGVLADIARQGAVPGVGFEPIP